MKHFKTKNMLRAAAILVLLFEVAGYVGAPGEVDTSYYLDCMALNEIKTYYGEPTESCSSAIRELGDKFYAR